MTPPSPRALRIGLAAAVLAAIAGHLALSPRNLARGRPVRASSVRLGDPGALVNGVVEYSSYAVHTKTETPAWILVDLQGIHHVGEVKLYSRGDGFLDEIGSHVSVELSEDGISYRRAGMCPGLFSQLSPCTIDAQGESARYVRLVHRSYLVLSEVEVLEAR